MDDLLVPLGRRVRAAWSAARRSCAKGETRRRDTTVLLVHGWLASAGLNWSPAFAPLGERFRVVAPDLRGHGRGMRSRKRFSLEDCADDLAALVEDLGCGPVIVVGYSMGGPIAQLLWRRHPDIVAGLVLCSTTACSAWSSAAALLSAAASMSYAAGTVRFSRMAGRFYNPLGLRPREPDPALAVRSRCAAGPPAEMRRHDMRQVLEAGQATCRFDSRAVDRRGRRADHGAGHHRPTGRSRAEAQHRLATSIPGATVREIDDDHLACTTEAFAQTLVDACVEVAARRSPLAVWRRAPAGR